jgi:hypothetical protein
LRQRQIEGREKKQFPKMKIKNVREYNEIFKYDIDVIEWCDGSKELCLMRISHFKNGKYHNENGPACEWVDGEKEWCLDGHFHYETGWKIEVENLKKNRTTNCLDK